MYDVMLEQAEENICSVLQYYLNITFFLFAFPLQRNFAKKKRFLMLRLFIGMSEDLRFPKLPLIK
jgi:hypothetical protein